MLPFVRPFIASLCAISLAQGAAAQTLKAVQIREAATLNGSVRCNLATVYRLAGRKRLNVRVSPKSNSRVIARLDEGHIVYVCEDIRDWLKVYFGGVEGPCFRTYEDGLTRRQALKCASGWVRRDRVNVLSG